MRPGSDEAIEHYSQFAMQGLPLPYVDGPAVLKRPRSDPKTVSFNRRRAKAKPKVEEFTVASPSDEEQRRLEDEQKRSAAYAVEQQGEAESSRSESAERSQLGELLVAVSRLLDDAAYSELTSRINEAKQKLAELNLLRDQIDLLRSLRSRSETEVEDVEPSEGVVSSFEQGRSRLRGVDLERFDRVCAIYLDGTRSLKGIAKEVGVSVAHLRRILTKSRCFQYSYGSDEISRS